MAFNRRHFMRAWGAATLAAAYPGLSFARLETDNRFVLVILRGALDGLGAVPPVGDPGYARLRQTLALAGSALQLDGDFALHPALAGMHKLYREGELQIVHAAATPYRERSHFDGQDVLENGVLSASGARDGWLNRGLSVMPGGASVIGDEKGIAVGQSVPLVLRGAARVTSWAPSMLPGVNDDTLERIAWMYDGDEFFASRLQQALAARDRIDDSTLNGGRGGGRQALDRLVQATGSFLADPNGPRIAVLETTGWDTHANQGAANGQLANRLGMLDAGIVGLKASLGGAWDNTVVAIVTEFGRTAAVNGTRGTDHGTASCAFLCGGAVDGGRVLADWPGLSAGALHEGRDLRPTTDLRAVFKGILRQQFDLDDGDLDRVVFPDSSGVQPAPLSFR